MEGKEKGDREEEQRRGGGGSSSMQNGWIYSCMAATLQAQQKTPDSISSGGRGNRVTPLLSR